MERHEYERMVDRFRRLVAPLPAWRVEEHDGMPVLVDALCGGGEYVAWEPPPAGG